MNFEIENGGESFVDNLRMQIKDAGGRTSESARIGHRLSRVVSEMMAAQGEILDLEKAIETSLTKEKLKSEELEKMVDELKETNLQLRIVATEAEEKASNLEKEMAEKDALVERLKLELGHTKELNLSCEKIASETLAELKKMKEEIELQESKNWDQCRYISLLETEVKQLMGESGKARDEAAALNDNLGKMKSELDEIKSQTDRVLEAQVENALLKVELHKWRSKAAAAEAAEERSKREKFALNRALQLAAASHQEVKTDNNNNVTISRKEYEVLSNKADEQVMMMEEKLGKLERELMIATHKIREMRTRAEQAISRAEAAEKAKAELEDKIRRRKEKEKEKKQFFKNLREQINSSREAASPDFAVINTPAIQTLSNVLEIPL